MNNTIQITINTNNQQLREQLIAQLAAINFDGFEENDAELAAFTEEKNYNLPALLNILAKYKLEYKKTIIKEQNWNEFWESNFEPVVVDSFCAVRAQFHRPISNVKHEIIITPKMSFGTGHHATTYMMVSEMSKLDFRDKSVADFGTGTGILAILAEKLGSKFIWAIDIDEWSIENATENIHKNQCNKIQLQQKDSFEPLQKFDIILANINRNVILSSIHSLSSGCKPGGLILLSGVISTDKEAIISAFIAKGFAHQSTVERSNWLCMLLQYKL